MGLNTEQTTAVIESVARVVDAAQPDVVQQIQPEPNYWWMLWIAVIGAIAAPLFLLIVKALSKRKKK